MILVRASHHLHVSMLYEAFVGGTVGQGFDVMPARIKVLLHEDQPVVLLDILQEFEDAGFEVRTANSVHDALDQLRRTRFDVAVFDSLIRGEVAAPLAEALKRGGTPYIICSSYDADAVSQKNAALCVSKPCIPSALVNSIRQLLGATSETVSQPSANSFSHADH